MAKRKRLSPANPDIFGAEGARAPEVKSMPGRAAHAAPIAQVAGEAAARAALSDLADAVEDARAHGLMIEVLPLDAVDPGYLVRDRLVQDSDEMAALMDSLRARGQQTQIEVVRLPRSGPGPSHGLISGWRRLSALRQLHEQTGEDRFASVRALVVRPETAQDAYVAMVEENEIRVNLSHYERARIALKAVQEGVYPSPRAALQGLYGTTTRSKRSKIGSFIGLVEALDGVLEHPAAISEKLGLALARRLSEDPGLADRLKTSLRGEPRPRPADEMRIIASALAQAAPAPRRTRRTGRAGGEPLMPGVSLRFVEKSNRIELAGPGVDAALHRALAEWIKSRG